MDCLYTLEEAKEILQQEAQYFRRQKLNGLILIMISILAPILVEPGAILFTIVILPFGIYLLITKKKIIRRH